ncbi:MAG: MarR family winged helix-turn-helix transcriptional regulator [Rhizobiaceae bacterium]
MKDEQLALEHFLPYRLSRLSEQVSRSFSAIYRERFGLTRPEWRTLATLGEFGRTTATAIGAHSSMHKTKVSRAVAALEKRRWLKRIPDDADRRVEHLELTKAGSDAYRELVPVARAFGRKLERALGTVRFAEFDRGLDALEAFLRSEAGGNDAPT